jgi:serine/threonine protein kinase
VKINTEHERRVEELFHRAVLLAEEEREGWLALECRADPALRADVEVLLRADGRVAPEFLQRAGPAVGTWFEAGERLGDYTIRERLGAGGMGVVYLAREARVERDVALKIVRPDLLFFGHGRERLQREIDAVARLKHANILPVYSAGEVAGVPFFTMEFVEGCTLSEVLGYLNRRPPAELTAAALSSAVEELARKTGGERAARRARAEFGSSWTEASFRIALAVAEALEHAHERGVLHRDVKPSNVMLTRDGRVLLLDFGLAASSEQSELTLTGFPVGTLPYMPPERLRGDPEPSGVKGDVYATGVMLFEVLTLRSPYLAANAEVTRARILEGNPPSLRSLNPQIPWDAETVCLTAMDRDPARRYDSAAALAEDLANVLERRPIHARRPGALLRARRFMERHPVASVAAALGFLLLASATAFAVVEASNVRKLSRANLDKDRALARATGVNDLLKAVLGAPDPWNTTFANPVAPETTVIEVLDKLRMDLEAGRKLDAAVAIDAQTFLGKTYDNLGRLEQAEPLLQRARDTARELYGEDARETIQADFFLASVYYHQGRNEEAIRVLESALERCERTLLPSDRLLRDVLNDLAVCETDSRAEELYRRMLDLSPDSSDPEEALFRAQALHNLGSLHLTRGELDESEPLLEEALGLWERYHPPGHVRILATRNELGALWMRQGRFADATPLFEQLMADFAPIFGDRGIWTLAARNNLAWAHVGTGRFAEAEELARATLDLLRDEPEDSVYALFARLRLAQALAGQEKREAAAPLESEAGRGFLEIERHDLAEPMLRSAFATYRELHGIEDPRTQASLGDLVRCLEETDRASEAQELRLGLASSALAAPAEETDG